MANLCILTKAWLCTISLSVALLATMPVSAQQDTKPDMDHQGQQNNLQDLVIQSGNQRHLFKIEIASDDASRAKGLMYRTDMAADAGMLFDFEKTAEVYMWMKNTYISLDMLFVKKDGTIRHIAHKTTPLSLSMISSGGPVRYVLEVKGGTAKRLGLNVGDRLQHQLFTP